MPGVVDVDAKTAVGTDSHRWRERSSWCGPVTRRGGRRSGGKVQMPRVRPARYQATAHVELFEKAYWSPDGQMGLLR
jgi:hypothetical protein